GWDYSREARWRLGSRKRMQERSTSTWETPPAWFLNSTWLKKLTRVPSASSRIWWSVLVLLAPALSIARAGSHVWPPSVVRENMLVLCGFWKWVHETYAICGLLASVVMEGLSFVLYLPSSSTIVVGLLQVSPPSVDLLTRTALVSKSESVPRHVTYTSPLVAKEPQGSSLWGQIPPEHSLIPGITTSCQLLPPLKLTPA